MFIQRIVTTINKYNMLKSGERIVIAVSGGADSVALLYVLLGMRLKWGFKLHLAHLNHMFRGEEAAQDAEFVRQLAQKHELPYSIEKFDVPAYKRRHKLSPQDAARRIRYQFLDKAATETGAAKIALGHTADDQAETMLMRILQGTGAEGLAGIPPQRGKYIRPLIETSRKQIEEFLKEGGIPFRQDASNLSPKYLRNKLRLQLLPQLEREYNPNLRNSLNQLAQIVRAEDEWQAGHIAQLLPQIVDSSSQAVSIRLEAFKKQPLAIKRRLLRWGINQLKGDLKGIGFPHIEQLLKLINSEQGYKELHLPGQIMAQKSYRRLTLTRQTETGAALSYDYSLNVPGISALPAINMEIEARIMEQSALSGYPAGNEAVLDFDKLKTPLSIRNRRAGDRFFPQGAVGAKKLKSFFIDHKTPLDQRDRIPLLVSADEIVWVCGYRISERYKISSDTKQVLWLKLRAAGQT